MTNWTGMRMHRSREGVCVNHVVQFQSCDGGSYCKPLGEMAALILSLANCGIPVCSDDGGGNSLKAEPMCTTKIIMADCPW